MVNGSGKKLTDLADEFLLPSNPTHRQYEALRTFFVDRAPSAEAAERFGYTPGSFRVLCHEFRKNPQREFFLPQTKKAKLPPPRERLRQKIITLRKQNSSVYDIRDALDQSGEKLSPASISTILKEEGFARLPRRRDDERPATTRPNAADVADAGKLDLSERTFRTKVGGLFLFLPYLAKIPLDKMLADAKFPGTKMMPAAHAIRSLLAMKLFGSARHSHVMSYVFDEGLALVYPEGARVVFPQHRGGLLETTARKDLVDGLAQVREDPQPDPTTSLLPARLIGVDDGAGPQRLHQGISGGLGTPGKTLHGTTQCGARHGETQHLLESQADLVVRHPADHLLERGEGEQPGPEMHRAHLERLRNQQRMLATDTPTTLLAVAMTHYELPGLGLDGRNVDLVQIDAPFRSYLTSARALLRARSLEGLVGNWVARTACRPYLDPGLRPGFFGSRFGLSLEKGAAWRLPARRDSSSTLSSLAIRASRSFN